MWQHNRFTFNLLCCSLDLNYWKKLSHKVTFWRFAAALLWFCINICLWIKVEMCRQGADVWGLEGSWSSSFLHCITFNTSSPAFCRISVIKAFCSKHAQQSQRLSPNPHHLYCRPRPYSFLPTVCTHSHTRGQEHLALTDLSTSSLWQTSWCPSLLLFKSYQLDN